MGDRYRYPPRPRSPNMYQPARVSLPLNVGYTPAHDSHFYAVPSPRRETAANPRSSSSSISSSGAVTTTTYKIKPDPQSRGSTVREGSRSRRSTIDSTSRPHVVPTIVTAAPRHPPVIHSAGIRPASPLTNQYRSSEEDYYAAPASSSHHGRHHRKRHSLTMDNADMNRLSSERERDRLRVAGGREPPRYRDSRSRPIYPSSLVRRPDTVADDYGDNGYGYTNPRDLVQYDLNNSFPGYPTWRDGYDPARGPINSTGGYSDAVVIPRSYEIRDRAPPPSTRGFDRIPGRPSLWEPSQARIPVPPMSAMDPIQRPPRVDPAYTIDPPRRASSNRPVSVYHDREARRPQREEYHEVRDHDPRDRRERSHRERYDDGVEVRGFGLRSERPERSDRPDDDRSDHKNREAAAAGLSIAGAALGINAVKNVRNEDREERDNREDSKRQREYNEEPRRHRDSRSERESVDLTARDPKDRRPREDDREVTPPRDRDGRDRSSPPTSAFVDLSGRDPKERPSSRDERDPRDTEADRREPRRPRADSAADSAVVESREDSSASDETKGSKPRRERVKKDSGAAAPAGFNPKDTMDLRALKEALAAKEMKKSTTAPDSLPRTPRASVTREPREAADIRSDLRGDERGRREPLAVAENRQPRVVSPPRDKLDDKPVRGILRQPREKFPEDPTPIREGVAPLKDAKKDGIPPDARWTKISRKMVNPEALEVGKERFEAREDFVIVLRVLSKEEVQAYATATQQIRAVREAEIEREERDERRRARRERHERHKRERLERSAIDEPPRRSRHDPHRDRGSHSESDSTESDDYEKRPKMLEAPKKRTGYDESEAALMSGGLGAASAPVPAGTSGLRENPEVPGQYLGYSRNPPPLTSSVLSSSAPRK